MVMWFHMATVSMQPWRIYLLCLIVYKSEPHNRFITSTTVLVYICYVFCFGTFNDASTAHKNGFDDDEDLKFQVPELNSKWKRRLFVILHDKLKIPDFREIPGTFNVERVDRDIRAGQF
ncbi:hypothetical protein HanPSC8_Chr10g0428551 [Helianthus annuus]|nr:hypothetical protein HanPSC8_Chr10g0428551 [Helianthus annuus]